MKKEKSYLVINIFRAWSLAKITAFWFPQKMFPAPASPIGLSIANQFSNSPRSSLFPVATQCQYSSLKLFPNSVASLAYFLARRITFVDAFDGREWDQRAWWLSSQKGATVSYSYFFSCLPESILVQWSRSQGCELTLEGRAVSLGAAFDSCLCRYCILILPWAYPSPHRYHPHT